MLLAWIDGHSFSYADRHSCWRIRYTGGVGNAGRAREADPDRKGERLVHDTRPLSIPVILGTPRQGRLSENVARLIVAQVNAREDVRADLIDVRKLPLSTLDAGEQIKDKAFSEAIMRADGLIIVAPEYN